MESENNYVNCPVCQYDYVSEAYLSRHMRHAHGIRAENPDLVCSVCGKSFSTVHIKKRHEKEVHRSFTIIEKCPLCSKGFSEWSHVLCHIDNDHHRSGKGWYFEKASVHGDTCVQYEYIPTSTLANNNSIEEYFNNELLYLNKMITHLRVKSKDPIKMNMTLHVLMTQIDPQLNSNSLYFYTKMKEIKTVENVQAFLSQTIDSFIKQWSDYQNEIVLKSVKSLTVNVAKCNSPVCTCGLSTTLNETENVPNLFNVQHIQKKIKNSKLTHNSFLWALATYFEKKHGFVSEEFLSTFIHDKRQLTKKIFQVDEIHKFCEVNKHMSLTFNVFQMNANKTLTPLLLSQNSHARNTVTLGVFWFQTSKRKIHDILPYYVYDELLEKHVKSCFFSEPITVEEPSRMEIMFENFEKTMPSPWVAFYDFEAISQEYYSQGDINNMNTQLYPVHYSLIVVNETPSIVFKKSYFGVNCMENFVTTLLDLQETFYLQTKSPGCYLSYPIDISEEQEQEYQLTTECYLCKCPFVENMIIGWDIHFANVKVRDYENRKETNNFLGAAHNRYLLTTYDCFKMVYLMFSYFSDAFRIGRK